MLPARDCVDKRVDLMRYTQSKRWQLAGCNEGNPER